MNLSLSLKLKVSQGDPITPLVNGEAVHSYLGNSSALLVQNSPGVSLSCLLHKAKDVSYLYPIR